MEDMEKRLERLQKNLDELSLEAKEKVNEELDNEWDFEDTPEYESDNLLEEAYDAETEKEARKLVKKALEVYPDNIDAQTFLANMEENPVNRLKKLDWAIENARKILEKEGCFEEDNIGVFWGILETRSYMRARNFRVETLMFLGRYHEAIKECEELLKLCESDNLGIRYKLMGLYCFLEEFDKCEELFKKYDEESAFTLLPISIMYYKKGDYKKAEKMIKILDEVNPYIVDNIVSDDIEGGLVEYYAPGSEEEAYIVHMELLYLLVSVPSFLGFLMEKTL